MIKPATPAHEIQIKSRAEKRTYKAGFDPVRTAKNYTLGWATVMTDRGVARFPAIVRRMPSKTIVFTPQDWHADPAIYGDLCNPFDWALATQTGLAKFRNAAARVQEHPSLYALHLPLTRTEQARVDRASRAAYERWNAEQHARWNEAHIAYEATQHA